MSAVPARANRRIIPLLSVLCAALIIGGVAAYVDINYKKFYIFQPGTAPLVTSDPSCRFDRQLDELALPGGQPCIRIDVPAGRAHSVDGKLLMVDVLVGPATAWQYVLHEVGLLGTFYPGSALVKNQNVLGSAPPTQLGCEDSEESVQATSDAPVAAFRALGDKVTVNHLGSQIVEVLPGGAAAADGLDCGDLIVGIDGRPIHGNQDLFAALKTKKLGEKVQVTVTRKVDGGTRRVTVPVTLRGLPQVGCGKPSCYGAPAEPDHASLGVSVEDFYTYNLPFQVSADVGNIGGPSDGLAITLGILNTLSGGKLLGGHTVAASGTISTGGAVGQVGGVAQKAVAVSRAGATLFLVPVGEGATARSTAGPHTKVLQVSSLKQAISDLEAIGGSLPTTAPS